MPSKVRTYLMCASIPNPFRLVYWALYPSVHTQSETGPVIYPGPPTREGKSAPSNLSCPTIDMPQKSFSPSVMSLTKCTFLMLGTLSKSCKLKYPFVQSNISEMTSVFRINDLGQGHNSIFLGVNHPLP